MTRIPFAARLRPTSDQLDPRTVVEQIQKRFPQALVDWNRGDEEVSRGIDQLRKMGLPDVYIKSKRKSLGQVAYVDLRNDRFTGLTGWFFVSRIDRALGDSLGLYSDPEMDIPFLKQLAADIVSQLPFEYLFSTDVTWGIELRSVPDRSDAFTFARERLPENPYGELSLRPLRDWAHSLRTTIPLWVEHTTSNSKGAMLEHLGSAEVLADDTVDALRSIDTVQAVWLIEIAAPFSNALVLEHEHWMSYISLNGAPKGILA
jgi:hypothetical protein